MLRQISVLLIGALVAAPWGFGVTDSHLITSLGRLVFGLMIVACLFLIGLVALWDQRWPMDSQ